MTRSFTSPPTEIADNEPVATERAGGSPPGVAPGYMLGSGEGPAWWFLGGLLTMKARAADTDGQFSVIEFAGPRGFCAPGHLHEHEAEAFYMLEGRLDVGIGDAVYRDAGPGAYFYVPKATVHEWIITSATAKFLCWVIPGGFEHFFEERSEPAQACTFPYTDHLILDREAVLQIGHRYGWKAARGPLGIEPTLPPMVGRLKLPGTD